VTLVVIPARSVTHPAAGCVTPSRAGLARLNRQPLSAAAAAPASPHGERGGVVLAFKRSTNQSTTPAFRRS
jgi:hypothetical protein